MGNEAFLRLLQSKVAEQQPITHGADDGKQEHSTAGVHGSCKIGRTVASSLKDDCADNTEPTYNGRYA